MHRCYVALLPSFTLALPLVTYMTSFGGDDRTARRSSATDDGSSSPCCWPIYASTVKMHLAADIFATSVVASAVNLRSSQSPPAPCSLPRSLQPPSRISFARIAFRTARGRENTTCDRSRDTRNLNFTTRKHLDQICSTALFSPSARPSLSLSLSHSILTCICFIFIPSGNFICSSRVFD